MKKSLIIILSLCVLIAFGALLIPSFHKDKVENIPKQTTTLVKTIQQEKAISKKALESLHTQNISLQKQLVQTKIDWQKSKANNQLLTIQVTQLKSEVQQLPVEDTSQYIELCLTLADRVDSLLTSNETQDSLSSLQTTRYDSIVCIQQNQIEVLGRCNENSISKIDTLLALNNHLQKQCKADKRKLAFTAFGNRFLASGLLITTSLATYLQLRNKI